MTGSITFAVGPPLTVLAIAFGLWPHMRYADYALRLCFLQAAAASAPLRRSVRTLWKSRGTPSSTVRPAILHPVFPRQGRRGLS